MGCFQVIADLVLSVDQRRRERRDERNLAVMSRPLSPGGDEHFSAGPSSQGGVSSGGFAAVGGEVDALTFFEELAHDESRFELWSLCGSDSDNSELLALAEFVSAAELAAEDSAQTETNNNFNKDKLFVNVFNGGFGDKNDWGDCKEETDYLLSPLSADANAKKPFDLEEIDSNDEIIKQNAVGVGSANVANDVKAAAMSKELCELGGVWDDNVSVNGEAVPPAAVVVLVSSTSLDLDDILANDASELFAELASPDDVAVCFLSCFQFA